MTLLLFGGVIMGGYPERPYSNVVVALLLLFMVSVALHTALYRARPAVDRLTGFYLWMAVGGALGGVRGILAPVLFDWTYEYPLLILAAGMLIPQQFILPAIRDLWWRHPRAMLVALAVAIGLVLALRVVGPSAWFGEERQGTVFLVIAALGFLTIGARTGFVCCSAARWCCSAAIARYRCRWSATPGCAAISASTRCAMGRVTASSTMARPSTASSFADRRAERTPTTYYAPYSGSSAERWGAAPMLYGPAARIGVVGWGRGRSPAMPSLGKAGASTRSIR